MNWTDENIDKLFRESAEKTSFAYKQDYWDAFSASLPSAVPSTDEELDALFQESAKQIPVTYKAEYWEEFSSSLPIIIPSTAEVNDAEVDALYRESSRRLSFTYKPAYWNEFVSLLPKRRRPDFLWFGSAGIFAGIALFSMFYPQNPIGQHVELQAFDLERNGKQETNGSLVSTLDPFKDKGATNSETGVNSPMLQGGYFAEPNEPGTNSEDVAQNGTHKTQQGNPAGNGNSNLATTNPSETGNPPSSNDTGLNEPIKRRNILVGEDPVDRVETNEQQTNEPTALPNQLNPLPLDLVVNSNGQISPWNPEIGKGRMLTQFYVQGLSGISQSSITPSESHSISYGLGFGSVFQKGPWSFNTGVNAILENYKDLHLTRQAKVYGFGSDSYQFDLFYQQLYVAELNFSAGYNFGRHQLNVGVRPSFTFGSKVTIAQSSVSSLNGVTSEDETDRQSVYGFMDGVKRWGIKPTFGYSFMVSPNWTVGLNVGMELMPSINETYINGKNNRLPIDGQLYLRKSLNFNK